MEAGGGPPSPPGRFLKAPQQRRAGPPPLPAPAAGTRGGRAGGLLRRLAELERRVETRRPRRWRQEEEEEEEVPATAPLPPLQRLLLHSGGASPSLPSTDSDGPTRPGHGKSFSEGSSLSSLDELFCGAAHSHASSSSDFQVNVLSLADLAPRLASQKEGLMEEEATAMETSGCLSFADPQSVFKPLSATAGGKAAAAMEEDPGEETEISEQLGGSSVECSSGEQNPSSAQYSEDFGSLAEDTPRLSSSENSHREGLDASMQAGLSAPSSPCLPPAGRRIPMKDVAVQTGSSSLPPQGLKTAAAVLDWMVGGPNAHQTVSMEALEELTSFRPAVSALNDTLKQNLLLIQQFVEASRHLHLSFVALLEEEEFHYHTLEEAKRYIDHHKCPPLTLEQALHELEEEKQAAG